MYIYMMGECNDGNTPSPTSSTPTCSSSAQVVVASPCAACKILRRRCADKCVLAPYFPPTDPAKFTIAHRVFGASNIIKFLQELPESQRADAVSSMVYEASARIRDPVYGCAGAICHLQKQVSELQAELAKAQAELVNLQFQQANMVALICMEMSQKSATSGTSTDHPPADQYHCHTHPLHHSSPQPSLELDHTITNLNFFDDYATSLNSFWEQPLWA